jgi:hypothetical protein
VLTGNTGKVFPVSTPIATLERLEIMRIRALVALVGLVLGLLALAPTVGLTQDEVSLSPPEVQRVAELVAACGDLAPNTLCYGGGAVEIGLIGGQEAPFEQVGDRRSLFDVERVQTIIDAGDCAWGGVVMNVQGSLSLSQPGMTFIALGNVVVENATVPETLFQPVVPVNIDLPSRVNIRTQPRLDADILTTTQSTTSLPADALSADGNWVRVLVGEDSAWVFRELVTSASDLSALPRLNENARGRMQAFTVRTEPTSCESQLPSLLLIQTPEGIPVPLTINGSAFTVGSTVVLTRFSAVEGSAQGLFGSDGGAGNPQGDLTAGEGVPPDPDYESLLVIEGSVAALLADGSVMPIAPGCAFHTLSGDGSVLPQDDRLSLSEPSLACRSDGALTGSDGGLDSSTFAPSSIETGGLDILDSSDPGTTVMPEYMADWAALNSNENYYCDTFEGISPQSGSILLAPNPSQNSQLSFKFPLATVEILASYAMSGSYNWSNILTVFHLVKPNGLQLETSTEVDFYDPEIVFDLFDPHDTITTLNYSYDDLLQLNLIDGTESSGALVWWVEFTKAGMGGCVTDLYTLNWSNNPPANVADAAPGLMPPASFSMASLSLLAPLNDLLLVDIGDQGISVAGYPDAWVEVNNNENPADCVGFDEDISPQSGSILLAPSPSANSQLSFTFRLVPSVNLQPLLFVTNSSLTVFHLARYNGNQLEQSTEQAYTGFQVMSSITQPGGGDVTLNYSYDDLIQLNLIHAKETSGKLVWWVEFTALDGCVTDLYTLNWSNSHGERSSETISTAVHNFPTPANTLPPTDSPLNTLGLSATPPFTLPSPTSVPPTNAPPPTNPPPTSVPPTNVPPTNPPPTANPDRDGDGVANDQDGCPDEAGPRENGGCPLPPPPPDGDGDGVPDEVDVCPGIPGPRDNRGCPARG